MKTPEAGTRVGKSSITSDEVDCVRRRVLVIDDEVGLVRAVRRTLKKNHDVAIARSGVEARRILEEDRGFDLILCDLMMPEVTGMDLHEWLAERDPTAADRMLFMTGGIFTPRARDFLKRVPNTCLEKPFYPQQVLEVLDRLES